MISVSTVTNLVQTTVRASLDHVQVFSPSLFFRNLPTLGPLILCSSYSTHCYILNMVIWSCHFLWTSPTSLPLHLGTSGTRPQALAWSSSQRSLVVLPLLSCFSNTSSSLKFQLSWLRLREVFPAPTPVAGGKPILILCWNCFFWLAFRWFCYYNHTEWLTSENSAPMPVKLECLC